MKISELIKTLQQRQETWGDVEVEITWEGVTRHLSPAHVYCSPPTDKYAGVLLLDADENFYKKDYAKDPLEGGSCPCELPLGDRG